MALIGDRLCGLNEHLVGDARRLRCEHRHSDRQKNNVSPLPASRDLLRRPLGLDWAFSL
jgi:hypothetical protein